jgi:hypothetical protein
MINNIEKYVRTIKSPPNGRAALPRQFPSRMQLQLDNFNVCVIIPTDSVGRGSCYRIARS